MGADLDGVIGEDPEETNRRPEQPVPDQKGGRHRSKVEGDIFDFLIGGLFT